MISCDKMIVPLKEQLLGVIPGTLTALFEIMPIFILIKINSKVIRFFCPNYIEKPKILMQEVSYIRDLYGLPCDKS